MSLVDVDVAKVKSVALISAYFMFDGGIMTKIDYCEEDSFYTSDVNNPNANPVKVDYDIVNLTTDKFFKLTLVDPEKM